ncbi:Uncharacterized protein PECH_002626 [Penicillium ucsense]|uniref:ZIP zinc/iron transport family n=1 Tax=Penicillium ucsense TaxID=2839758 RepID=A0A8J8WDR5_9EURO|nr:Uncharacterized protein PECM_002160 [Penicillium ucsense]KAF7730633.1 Uncharacterized protein PECH_002626 [Penicillium ucsense]
MATFDPHNVDLDTVDQSQIICYLALGQNEYTGSLGARVSSIFVIGIVSSVFTFFPVVAKRAPRVRIPLYVYLFARYFGAGVIIATAFVHLLDPAYSRIGSQSCVGMTGHWGDYAWCPAIVLFSLMMVFLLDFGAERYVEKKYGICREDPEPIMTTGTHVHQVEAQNPDRPPPNPGPYPHPHFESTSAPSSLETKGKKANDVETLSCDDSIMDRSFRQQISAFLIMEFGVIFHSVIIGLNLGVTGDEFATLYPVLVFHQSFEGLGIGARMSAIPFRRDSPLPWLLCAAYGLTTPIAIAVGLGVRTTYNPDSFTAMVVAGVLDAVSAGILIYTGLVELLARDFLFDPHRTTDDRRLTFMLDWNNGLICLY